jgi:hypothetical protein
MVCALEYVKEGATSNNVTKIIIKAIQALITMSREEVAKRMIAFGANEFLDPCKYDSKFQFYACEFIFVPTMLIIARKSMYSRMPIISDLPIAG